MDSHITPFVVVCVFYILTVGALDKPEVELSTGRLRGLREVSAANRVIYSFRGIPYAAPPIKDLRFKAPQPPESWNGTRNAFNIPPACIQNVKKTEYLEHYSEDCLYLNVFTPYFKPPGDNLMAVMVWIHGEKMDEGSSTSLKYGADFLVTEDVVVVTFNYRLGLFGYLNAKTKSAQGNAGEKDKVAALRWVQKEISKFGGDPNRVTIFGGSSGGQDVNCLYLSPMAQGLFHRAITQSSAYCGIKSSTYKDDPTVTLGKLMHCSSFSAERMVACLRNAGTLDLIQTQTTVMDPTGENINLFTLTVEENYGEEVFMAVPPEKLLRNSTSKIPYMMGMTSGEGKMLLTDPRVVPSQLHRFQKYFESYLPNEIRRKSHRNTIAYTVEAIQKYYFNNEPVTLDNINGYTNFMMDSQITYYMTDMAKTLSTHAPVYLYYFAFEGEFKIHRPSDTMNLTGANHGEELGYLFYCNILIPEQNHMIDYPRECTILTQMVRLWTNFAKYGNPTPNKRDGLLGVKWLPVKKNMTYHLVINNTLHMNKESLLPERVDVWEMVFQWMHTDMEIPNDSGPSFAVFIIILAITCGMYVVLSKLFLTNEYENID